MDAALVLVGLLVLIVAVGLIMMKAWSVNKQAERAKALEQQA
jgi:Tfp pilus assembly protein PilN